VAPHAEPQSVFQKTVYITGFLGTPSGMTSSCAEITGRFMHPTKTTITNIFFSLCLMYLVKINIYSILKLESKNREPDILNRFDFILRNN